MIERPVLQTRANENGVEVPGEEVSPFATSVTFCEDLELTYSLYDPWIPRPQIGFRGDWAKRHSHISDILADHRSCPAISRREGLGITLFMPHTARFFRDGSVEITDVNGPNDNRLFKFAPIQGRAKVLGKHKPFVDFPACLMLIPAPATRQFRLGLFLLGDVRLNTWIIDSGVFLREIPKGYTAFITPLPNHDYPSAYSISQGVAESVPRFMGHLKIPVDLNFGKLPPEQNSILLEKGTPMIQWTIMKIPRILLRQFPETQQQSAGGMLDVKGNLHCSNEVLQQLSILMNKGTLTESAKIFLQSGHYRLEVKLTSTELSLLVLAARQMRVDEALEQLGLVKSDALAALQDLIDRGLVYIVPASKLEAIDSDYRAWQSASQEGAWDEIYQTGRFYRWHIDEPSQELHKAIQLFEGKVDHYSALDIGCGTGAETIHFAKRGFKTFGMDISTTAIDWSTRRARKDNTPVELLRADITTIRSPFGEFEFVNDRGCFHHMTNDQSRISYVENVSRNMKPGGLLFLRGYRAQGEKSRYALVPALGRTISNYLFPLNETNINRYFDDYFRVEFLRPFRMRTDQVEFPGILAFMSRRGAEPIWPKLLESLDTVDWSL